LPPLFIAGELRTLLQGFLDERDTPPGAEDSARLEVEFAAVQRRGADPTARHLELACRAVLSFGGERVEAQGRTGQPQ
jgi:hypothetical protein